MHRQRWIAWLLSAVVTVSLAVPVCAEVTLGVVSTSNMTKRTSKVKNSPKAPTGLQARVGDCKVNLLWNKVANADGYQVLRYDSASKKERQIRDLTATSCNNGSLVLDREYRYRVYAYRTVGGVKYRSAKASNTVKVRATKTTARTEENANGIHSIRYTAKVKNTASQYLSASSTQKMGTIKVGTTLKVLYRQYRRAKVELPSGRICWVVNENLKYEKTHYTTKDYTKAEKEYYVNSEGYTSDTKYLIWISLYSQRVNIFEGSKGRWKLIRNARCATGTINKPTPVGSYKIQDRSAAGWDYGSYYVKPVVQFYGPYFFHSRLIYYKGGYKDATIGKPASAGCIRMYNEDIKFIYDKMSRGTRVISY